MVILFLQHSWKRMRMKEIYQNKEDVTIGVQGSFDILIGHLVRSARYSMRQSIKIKRSEQEVISFSINQNISL